jgi:hypothetical protein
VTAHGGPVPYFPDLSGIYPAFSESAFGNFAGLKNIFERRVGVRAEGVWVASVGVDMMAEV